MPISTSSFGDERDDRYSQYQSAGDYDRETLTFPGITPLQAETYLKRLGGGVEEKLRRVEGIGWVAEISETDDGVDVTFSAHDELLDDLIRRFEEWSERDAG
ncbi:MAG: hypothetical protein KIT77_05915 [Caldilinea sp.]|nr:hypothetical protein [Caldilinea sp.]MCB0069171.1 hypothetical protein [Caldilineaceae bacterium]MCB9114707.1 hypothetical protein [Caldilineaceae bacterium]MCW5840767.1 hypothetical protein [Caldilinea sp.]